jgi:hypothetical protein
MELRLKDFKGRIKVVASNVRAVNISDDLLVSPEGVGYEGDLILVKVVSREGAYDEVENLHGRLQRVYFGDYFIGVLGNRESSTFLVGGVPQKGLKISKGKSLDLLCNGGIVGNCRNADSWLEGSALKLEAVGLLKDHAGVINVKRLCNSWDEQLLPSRPIIVVCGTSSETGKTTISGTLIDGFIKLKNLVVASTKVTGTGRLKDLLKHKDAGANPCFDFPDIGLPSTYTAPERYLSGIFTLLNKLNRDNPDLIVAEMGGDIIWANAPTFLKNASIQTYIKAVIITSNDIIGAEAIHNKIRQWGVNRDVFIALPLRNHEGSKLRIAKELRAPFFDHTKIEDIKDTVEKLTIKM